MTRIGMRGWLAVFSCALAASVGTTHADIIGYSIQGYGDGQLYSIDLVTGQTTAIGATGFDNVLGLSFQRSTGILFGIDSVTDMLLTFSLANGQATPVGSLGIDITFGAGLAFDNAGNLYLASEGDENFYSVDAKSGQAMLVGGMGQSVMGLAYSDGIMYGLADTPDHNLVSIDLGSGFATTIGRLNAPDVVAYGGIDFAPTGELWAIFGNSGGLNTTALINIETGNSTPVAGLPFGFTSLAIPAPSALALLGLAGLTGMRRRRR